MRRTIIWAPTAKKYLSRIEPEDLKERVKKRICDLAANPTLQQTKKLGNNIFRVRQGQFRIIYGLTESEVKILKIGHRREVYRRRYE